MKLVGAKRASIRHVSGGMKHKQHRSRTPRNSRQQSLVMKLACVAQDIVDIAEAVQCLVRHERATSWTHVRIQEVWSTRDEEQEMRVDVSATNLHSKS